MLAVVFCRSFERKSSVTTPRARRSCLLLCHGKALPLLSALAFTLLTILGCPVTSIAATLCDSAPSTFRVDSLLVKRPGEQSFIEADASNFCYRLNEFSHPSMPDIKDYAVALNVTAVDDTPAYPPGTLFRFTVINQESSFRLGAISSTSPTLLASYADEAGGSPREVSIQVELGEGQTEIATTVFLADSSSGYWYQRLQRVTISRSALNPIGLPDLYFSSETGQFELQYTFQGYPSEGAYDSYIDVFFPMTTLTISKLTKSILDALTDEMLMTMFTTAGGDGMRVTSLLARKSYGERQNLNGSPTSNAVTGMVVRMELKNDGWAPGGQSRGMVGADLTFAAVAPMVQAASGAGGFRLSRSARTALKACTAKRKLKKGYRFVKLKSGRGIACQRTPAKRR